MPSLINTFNENKLYFVTNELLSLGRSDLFMVEEAIKGGVRIIQLRDKTATKKKLLAKALELKRVIDKQKDSVIFIINDHLDIALATKADGVHLGQEDLPVSTAKEIIKKLDQKIIVGASTHNLKEALKAQKEGADYINVGPIFFTKTKRNNYPPHLLERLYSA